VIPGNLRCPRCGERVDEVEGKESPIPTVVKRIKLNDPRGAERRQEFAYCPHCGTVLAHIPTVRN
jgi:hypothetical protein